MMTIELHSSSSSSDPTPDLQGIVGCGVSFVLVTWCIEKRGVVFVAAFIPVVQIIVSIMDFSILHEQLYLGRYVLHCQLPCLT